MFEVILSPEAQAFYAAADRPLAQKLAKCLKQLEHDPRHHNNIKRLSGALAGRSGIASVIGGFFFGLKIGRIE